MLDGSGCTGNACGVCGKIKNDKNVTFRIHTGFFQGIAVGKKCKITKMLFFGIVMTKME